MGIIYRSWQFWQALLASPSVKDKELVRSILSEEQVRLFELMQPDEQMHCIKTAYSLIEHEHTQTDLLAAALLHDIGKINHPLKLWERAWLVIGNTFFPKLATRWHVESDGDVNKSKTWQRVFIIHQKHAEWGAELARKAGVSPICANLIRRHQDKYSLDEESIEDQLLSYLQKADNLS